MPLAHRLGRRASRAKGDAAGVRPRGAVHQGGGSGPEADLARSGRAPAVDCGRPRLPPDPAPNESARHSPRPPGPRPWRTCGTQERPAAVDLSDAAAPARAVPGGRWDWLTEKRSDREVAGRGVGQPRPPARSSSRGRPGTGPGSTTSRWPRAWAPLDSGPPRDQVRSARTPDGPSTSAHPGRLPACTRRGLPRALNATLARCSAIRDVEPAHDVVALANWGRHADPLPGSTAPPVLGPGGHFTVCPGTAPSTSCAPPRGDHARHRPGRPLPAGQRRRLAGPPGLHPGWVRRPRRLADRRRSARSPRRPRSRSRTRATSGASLADAAQPDARLRAHARPTRPSWWTATRSPRRTGSAGTSWWPRSRPARSRCRRRSHRPPDHRDVDAAPPLHLVLTAGDRRDRHPAERTVRGTLPSPRLSSTAWLRSPSPWAIVARACQVRARRHGLRVEPAWPTGRRPASAWPGRRRRRGPTGRLPRLAAAGLTYGDLASRLDRQRLAMMKKNLASLLDSSILGGRGLRHWYRRPGWRTRTYPPP